jgi:hypothetical protein
VKGKQDRDMLGPDDLQSPDRSSSMTTTTLATIRPASGKFEDINLNPDPDEEGESKSSSVRDGIRTGSLFVLGLIALGTLLVYLQFIFIPLIISRFLVYVFQPFMNLLTGHRPVPFTSFRVG